jgi:hypothetical protein
MELIAIIVVVLSGAFGLCWSEFCVLVDIANHREQLSSHF